QRHDLHGAGGHRRGAVGRRRSRRHPRRRSLCARAQGGGLVMRLLVLLLAGCTFEPAISDGKILCGDNGLCPPGFTCGGDGRCWRHPPAFDFSMSDLTGADLAGADFSGDDLTVPDLEGADLTFEVVEDM